LRNFWCCGFRRYGFQAANCDFESSFIQRNSKQQCFFFKENNVNDLKKKLLTAIEKTNKQKEFYKKNLKLFLKKYNSQKISNHTWKVFEEVVKPNYN
jgi:hypothetical protein